MALNKSSVLSGTADENKTILKSYNNSKNKALMSITQNNSILLDGTIPIEIVTLELFPELAPNHVSEIKSLINGGYYNGIIFHRVMDLGDGFVAQTGDLVAAGYSITGNIKAEFSSYSFLRGTLGMARSQHPDSANSQFFICFQEASFLNNQYTVFGRVTEGMEFIDAIVKGEPPEFPDKIISLTLSN